MMLRHSSRNKRQVLLNVEPLEQRDCPVVSIANLSGSLVILGDSTSDQIAIVDRGSGNLNVNGTDYTGVSSLTIEAKGGDDTVTYETQGELSLVTSNVNLGSGDDIAEMNFGKVSDSFESRIEGGTGDDFLRTVLDAVFASTSATSVMDGGNGEDVIHCEQNHVAGEASCNNVGRNGDDRIFCEKTNVLQGGIAGCTSDGGGGR